MSAYSLKSQASSQSFGVTSAHPFWSVTRDEFVPAGDLEYGEQVVTIDGQLWHLTTITPRAGPETVYNFEVAGEHVYYVGSEGVLVHNVYATKGQWFTNTGNLISQAAAKRAITKKAKRLMQKHSNEIRQNLEKEFRGQLVAKTSLGKELERRLADRIAKDPFLRKHVSYNVKGIGARGMWVVLMIGSQKALGCFTSNSP